VPAFGRPLRVNSNGQVFLKAKRSKHRRRLDFETSGELRGDVEKLELMELQIRP
jgi:hypothetical protein